MPSTLTPEEKREVKSAVTAASTRVLVKLRNQLRADGEAGSFEELKSKPILFDTIARTALEQVSTAYRRILDDPVALEALKKELTSG